MVAVRLQLMGSKAPEFAPADNPSADCPSWMTRSLTFLHLPAFNLWLLIQPTVLSFDWSMEAIPLIHSFIDSRNVSTLAFYATLTYAGWTVLRGRRKRSSTSTPNSGLMQLDSTDDSASSVSGDTTTEDLVGCTSAMLISSALLAAVSDPSLSGRSNGCHPACCSPPAYLPTSYVSGSGRSSSAESCGSCSAYLRSERTRWSSSSSRSSVDGRSSSSSSSSTSSRMSSSSSNKGGIRRGYRDLTVIALSMMVLPFIPATNLFFYVGFVVAERVLYIPSAGYCLLVALGCHLVEDRLCRRRPQQQRTWLRKCFRFVLLLLLVLYSARTIRRNQDWLTEESLYRSGISINPPKGRSLVQFVSLRTVTL